MGRIHDAEFVLQVMEATKGRHSNAIVHAEGERTFLTMNDPYNPLISMRVREMPTPESGLDALRHRLEDNGIMVNDAPPLVATFVAPGVEPFEVDASAYFTLLVRTNVSEIHEPIDSVFYDGTLYEFAPSASDRTGGHIEDVGERLEVSPDALAEWASYSPYLEDVVKGVEEGRFDPDAEDAEDAEDLDIAEDDENDEGDEDDFSPRI